MNRAARAGLGARRRRIGTRASGSRWLVHEFAFLKRRSLTLEFSFDCRIHRRFRNGETELTPDVSQIYWNIAETAPDRVMAQVRVTDLGGADYLLPYPCEFTKEGWVNAASGKPLAVRVKYWKLYVETLPKSKAGKRRTPPQRTDTARD
jgi:hypothetical protein